MLTGLKEQKSSRRENFNMKKPVYVATQNPLLISLYMVQGVGFGHQRKRRYRQLNVSTQLLSLFFPLQEGASAMFFWRKLILHRSIAKLSKS